MWGCAKIRGNQGPSNRFQTSTALNTRPNLQKQPYVPHERNGDTALCLAARAGEVEVAALLLDAGALNYKAPATIFLDSCALDGLFSYVV